MTGTQTHTVPACWAGGVGERFPVRVKIAELRESGCFSEGEMPSENGRKNRGAVVIQAEGHACEFLLGERGVARVGADRASVAGAQTAVDGGWHEAGGACRARPSTSCLGL